MAQSWHDLLFAHWPLPVETLAPLIPPGLTLDTFDGRAWIGVIPFRMSGVRLRGLPPMPGAAAFPELDVRTYVTDRPREQGGRPGARGARRSPPPDARWRAKWPRQLGIACG